MDIVRVAPISRGVVPDELTYFSAIPYAPGALVRVSVRNSEHAAVVLSSEMVTASKADVRSARFALKKLPRQQPTCVLPDAFVRAAATTAQFYACSIGAVLFSCLPKALERITPVSGTPPLERPRLRGFIVPRVYQGLAQSRVEFYRTAVREAFAAHGSVLLVAPTIVDVERLSRDLTHGIDRYVYLLHGGQSDRVQRERIESLSAEAHPVLIIVTQGFLALPRHDVSTVIVEHEGAPLFRVRSRPFIDVRVLAQAYATELGGQLFLADLPLRIESVFRRDTGEYEEVVTGNQRTQFPAPAQIISQKGTGREPKRAFHALGTELVAQVANHVARGDRVFLYVARRGLSPITLCGDCGLTVTCNECGASVVLHRGAQENYFLCHACGAMRHARERCTACTSWRLETLGIGTELVEREVSDRYGATLPVHVLSSDTVRTHRAAIRMVREWYEHGGVLIGTELAVPYLIEQIPLVAVVSLDSLLSLASWNVYERVASTLTRLREVAAETFLLQTRHPDVDMLTNVLTGNFSAYYRNELATRKELGYPPFTVLIKVTVSGTEEDVARKMEFAVAHLKPFELITFARLLRTVRGTYTLNGFVRMRREEWPNEELRERLRSLPPAYTVTIDPDSIL